MVFSNEQLAKVRAAESAAEILKLAEGEGIALTEEEARYAFVCTHMTEGELPDEELENVSGGVTDACYKSGNTPKFNVGDRVKVLLVSSKVLELEFYDWFTGTVLSVSEKRSSTFGICTEWHYDIRLDSGKTEENVYEHDIKMAD